METRYKCIACSTTDEQVLVNGYEHSESGMLACERCGSNELEEMKIMDVEDFVEHEGDKQ